MINSAIYKGKVFHTRHVPHKHHFFYRIFLFWLDLSELQDIERNVRGFSIRGWAPARFRRADYLGDPKTDLQTAVLEKMSALNKQPLAGKVFLLGQVRMFGLYFSPVNFYYLQQSDGQFSHVLAEVSNTPWNQRHCYLVDLAKQSPCDKAFHVSPFNPMDMRYHWKIFQPDHTLKLHLSCHKQDRHFDASLQLEKINLNSFSLFNVMASIPSMTLKTVFGIYWQAFKLFVKGTPIYPHPKSKTEGH